MQLLRLLILACSCYTLSTALEKREIVASASAASKHSEVIEGSGDPKSSIVTGSSPDQEIHGSGYGSDDEDSVARIEGSGDVVEGSGAAPSWSSVPAVTTTTTTTHAPPPRIEDDHEVMENHALGTSAPEYPPKAVELPSTTTPVPTMSSKATRRPLVTAPPPVLGGDDPSYFQNLPLQPGIFAALIVGAIVGLLTTILLVMFIVYRMRKKDEGSYALEEQSKTRPYTSYAYHKAGTNPNKEFYA